ncbi:hypothetical protein AVEN_44681-1 [Araneus ventricosus]|uniref:Uncharacterized protein n=1 Tax=Araneus ventricosus TaxID=182803 RepID=A0A4Y2WXX2_ARAVE|nr:hypothetical protein AVEN_44681-1 [Araneus ventricosus]
MCEVTGAWNIFSPPVLVRIRESFWETTVVLRGSRSLNLAIVARSLAISLLRPQGGTILRALSPGVPVNLGAGRPPKRRDRVFWGKKELGGISPALHGS